MTDFAKWKSALAARSNVTFHTYAALNHYFMPGTGPATPDDYAKVNHVAPQVVADIAEWISAH